MLIKYENQYYIIRMDTLYMLAIIGAFGFLAMILFYVRAKRSRQRYGTEKQMVRHELLA
jgi:hypothetical protein